MSNLAKHRSTSTRNVQLSRSSLHQRLLPDELMMAAFGKLNPSVSERTMYFFDMWMDSKNNILHLKNSKAEREEVDKHCRVMGLLPLWDYQIKGKEARFLRAEDLAMIKLSWNNDR